MVYLGIVDGSETRPLEGPEKGRRSPRRNSKWARNEPGTGNEKGHVKAREAKTMPNRERPHNKRFHLAADLCTKVLSFDGKSNMLSRPNSIRARSRISATAELPKTDSALCRCFLTVFSDG